MGSNNSKNKTTTIKRPKTAKLQNSILKPSQTNSNSQLNNNNKNYNSQQSYQTQPQNQPGINNTYPQQPQNNNQNQQLNNYYPSQQQTQQKGQPNSQQNFQQNTDFLSTQPPDNRYQTNNNINNFDEQPIRPTQREQPQINGQLQEQRKNAMQQPSFWNESINNTPRKPTYDIEKWKYLLKMMQENLKLVNYVHSRPRRTFKSINELGVFIRNSPAQSDIELAWIIYLWISQNIDYDVDGFRTGIYNDQDLEPDGVMTTGRTISWGYAHLFEELCKAVDLECISISGFAKGLTYRQNHAFIDPNHEWNAVKLNGVWQLVDCTWGTGYVSDEFIFYRKFIPYYFLTPPQIFIYDHFSEQYQLQPQKMSLRRFERLPLLKLEFFLQNVKCLSHDIYTAIRPIERNFKMEFTCDEDTVLLGSLEKMNGDIIENAVAIQFDRVKRIFELFITLPNGKESLLNLFTRKNGEESQFCGEIFLHAPVNVEASVISLSDSDSESETEEVYVVQKPRREKLYDVIEVDDAEEFEEPARKHKNQPVEWNLEFEEKGKYEIVVPPEYKIEVKEKYDYYIQDQSGRTSKLVFE